MNKELRERIEQWNQIKYPLNIKSANEARIVIATLKPIGTVTTAPNNKE